MNILPDIDYQPDMVKCPLCGGTQMVMARYRWPGAEGSGRIVTHLANGEWCPQTEFYAAPLQHGEGEK